MKTLKLALIATITAILIACGASSSGSSSSGSSTSNSSSVVNCASGSLCPPSQVNVVSPKSGS